jgi:hypothetical protein
MVVSAEAGYSSDWVSEAGLDLEAGYCITLVRAMGPREALHRLGVSDTAIRTATWPEFTAELDQHDPFLNVAAAFVMGEHVALVEWPGYRGSLPEWAQPVSRGTETINVYLSPKSGAEELNAFRDGKHVAFIGGDAPEVIESDDAELAGRLIELTYDALEPWNENDPAPEDLSDGHVDLLQVACDYLGLQPQTPDISGPVLGALMQYR